MLQPVDVLVQRRRASRHAVDLRCDVVTDAWPEPVSHRIRDLGLGGLFVESQLLPDEGSDVLVELRAPRGDRRLTLVGKVRRCELRRRRRERERSGFAVELGTLSDEDVAVLARALRGLPPPLPTRPRTPTEELVWVEALDPIDHAEHDLHADGAARDWEQLDPQELDAAFDRMVAGELLSAAVVPFFFVD